MSATRADAVRVARTYVGTPFQHMGRLPGVGLDCAGVLVCLARELHLVAPDFDTIAYSQLPDGSSMMRWCGEYMDPKPRELMVPGDVVLLITDEDPQHLALLGDYPSVGTLSIIHAAAVARPPRVIETRLMFSRAMRFAAAFSFRGIST
jgi:cell wall-associated NlpC family hydrolase